jgi:uncharacterized protein (DUF2147 family)
MKIFWICLFIAGSVFFLFSDNKPGRDEIYGFWINESKNIIVQMYDDQKGITRGKIVWLRDSLDNYGGERRDIMNSNVKLRSRKLVGIDIFYGYKYDASDHEWEGGTIYNFDNGTEYHGKMWIDENGQLRVRGYWWIFFFLSKTKTWTRIDNPHAAPAMTNKH